MIITEPGIYKDVSLDDYHSSDGISASGVNLLIPPNCPKMYWYKYLSGEYTKPDTASQIVGRALHCMVLESHEFDSRFCVCIKVDRRTKEGKKAYEEFVNSAGDKEILSEDQFMLVNGMAESILNHSVFKSVMNDSDGHVEESIAWKDEVSGALLRSRPDFYNDSVIVDIKTTRDVRPESFVRSIVDYGYHIQAAMACDALTAATGKYYDTVILFVVSKEAPYLIRSYMLGYDSITTGRVKYKYAANVYADCLATGVWPGYDESVEEIDIPAWAKITL